MLSPDDETMGRLWKRAATTKAYEGIRPVGFEAWASVPFTPIDDISARLWCSESDVQDRPATSPSVTLADGAVIHMRSTFVELIDEGRTIAPSLIGPGGEVSSVLALVDPHDDVFGLLAPHITFDLESELQILTTPITHPHAESTVIATRPDMLIGSTYLVLHLADTMRKRGSLARAGSTVRHVRLTNRCPSLAHLRKATTAWSSVSEPLRYAPTGVHSTALPCENGKMHLLDHNRLIAEVLRSDGTVGAAVACEVGELVVTPLAGQATVLLRVRTGEIVRLEMCECGSAAPVVEVIGRV